MGPEGVEPTPYRLKGGYAAITPRPRWSNRRQRFERITSNHNSPPFAGLRFAFAAGRESLHAMCIDSCPVAGLWLFDNSVGDNYFTYAKAFYLAALQEAAGQRDDALTNYRFVVQQAPPSGSPIREFADAAIGSPGVVGGADGQGTEASFDQPTGIAIDANGNLYVGNVFDYSSDAAGGIGVVSAFARAPLLAQPRKSSPAETR